MCIDRFWVCVGLAAAAAFAAGASVTSAQEAVPAVGPATAPAEVAPAAPAEAAPAVPAEVVPKDRKLPGLWEDFLYYIRVASPDIAASFGQAILESGAEPREIYLLAVDTATAQADLARGARLPALKGIILRIRKMIEQGYEAERADPDQIKKAIEMLVKGPRAYELARRRLQRSGEYALPQLIQKLTDPQASGLLKERIVTVLPSLGKEAVRGLSVALNTKDAWLQEVLANALGEIEYPHAVPRLKELHGRKGILKRTGDTVAAALISCGGRETLKKGVAELYYDLALKYYYRAESVVPDERYDRANVWYWQEGLGLVYKPVPRAIFCDVYAMRMARLTLTHDAKFYPAVSLWIAANIQKEAGLPAGATDPTRGADQPSARFYALASSAKYLQDVLACALRDRNTVVAVGAVTALAATQGADSLVEPVRIVEPPFRRGEALVDLSGGTQPLVSALSYGDQRVSFLAAESLVKALPKKRFEGYQLVMTVLSRAVRQTGRKSAMLLAADTTQRNRLKDAIRAAGCDVIDEPHLPKAIVAAHASSGVDVAVVGTKPAAAEVVATLRRNPVFAGLPVVIADDTVKNSRLADSDGRAVVIAADADADAVAKALAAADALGTGKTLTAEEAAEWAVKAAECIRLVGLTKNAVYDPSRTQSALIDALGDARPNVQTAAAGALAVMKAAKAQQAIANLGLKADADEGVRIAVLKLLSESIRRFGNQATESQAQGVIDIVVAKAPRALREAAAQVLGAMNLPSEKIKMLIVEAPGDN